MSAVRERGGGGKLTMIRNTFGDAVGAWGGILLASCDVLVAGLESGHTLRWRAPSACHESAPETMAWGSRDSVLCQGM